MGQRKFSALFEADDLFSPTLDEPNRIFSLHDLNHFVALATCARECRTVARWDEDEAPLESRMLSHWVPLVHSSSPEAGCVCVSVGVGSGQWAEQFV